MKIRKSKKILKTIDNYLKGRLSLAYYASSINDYRDVRRISKRPVFICGCGRSGTTLILSILSCHPKVYSIPYETKAFCPGVYDNWEDPNNIMKSKGEPFWLDVINKELAQKNISGKVERWCEKTPMNVHFVREINNFYNGNATFINMVRDGRNVVTSRHPNNKQRYWVSPKRWIRDVEAGKKLESMNQFMTIRYEDIITDYASMCQKICNFLGLKYSKKLENLKEESTITRHTAWDSKVKGIKSKVSKRYTEKSHKKVVNRLMEKEKAKYLMKYYEYIE